ncbi:MAG TPA: carbon monoxide dehydrogenase subunit G [Candidatus Acidoferrales bacterium]|nr:carbon monoxide dehydrogenase subunit G [Candidatus Acidoferrales bacterium]HEV2341879.1 carbon monoxide dehydrogenase subunit G [Candidatus Acidoferrales bacterium]
MSGTAALPAKRDQVWDLLNDPARLAKCLPGAERLEPDGPDRYKVTMKFGIAAFSGKFQGSVELADKNPPESLKMRVEGRGAPGFMKGEGTISLHNKGAETEVKYDGEAHVGGVIASVGQRMIEVAAKKIVAQFFDSAARELRSHSAAG